MNVRELRKVLVVLIIALCLMPMGAMAATGISCTPSSKVYNALDEALNSSDTACILLSDINSTLTAGNLTVFNRTMSITSNSNKILLNNTLQFWNDTTNLNTITFADGARFVKSTTGQFVNNSAIEITGSKFTIAGSNVTLDLLAFSGTGVNISGSTNTLQCTWNVSSVGTGAAFNVNGTFNTLNSFTGNISTSGFGVNISGQSGTINFIAKNISAPLGKFGIMPTAVNNTITPENVADAQSWFTRPTMFVYNGTGSSTFPYGPAITWFFFNSSQSAGGNMNVTINLSKSMPFVGNVSILANISSVSSLSKDGGGTLQNWTNSTLTVVNGNSGGYIYNTTSNVIFGNGDDPSFVGVYYDIGPNTAVLRGSNVVEYIPIDNPAVIINGNPNGNVPVLNTTYTTNFTTINDFSRANLTFLMENPAHQFLANITFTNINMTDQNVGTAIRTLGQSLINSTVGSKAGFNMSIDGTNGATNTTFNVPATLRTYPRSFTPLTKYNTKLYVIADLTGSRSLLWDGSGWVGSASSDVNTSIGLTIGTEASTGQTYIEIPSLHFSTYENDPNTPSSSSSEAVSGGSGGLSATPVPTQWVTTLVATPTPGTPTTIGINVGGSSVITKVAVTGTGINDVIVTALPHTDLSALITRPATTVYQYVTVSPARYTTISSATFNFNIPTSWLAEKGYTKNDIVLTVWDTDAKAWTTLPTSIVSENNGIITYQAITPHMSEFAIVYQKGSSAQAQANVTAIQTSVPLKTATPVLTTNPSIRPTTPTPTQTVPPAAGTPPTGGIPLTTMVIAVVGIIVIVVGAFLVHRWWVRKQNPSLFKELD